MVGCGGFSGEDSGSTSEPEIEPEVHMDESGAVLEGDEAPKVGK